MRDWQLSRKAAADLENIAFYTEMQFGETQARRYTADILHAIETVADFSFLGRDYTTKKGNTFKRYNIGRHALFYTPTDTGIFVVRILHLMMDFDSRI